LRKFRYLARNCRNKGVGEKKTSASQNRFKMLSSRMMKYGVKIRKQKRERKEKEAIQCFKYKEEEH